MSSQARSCSIGSAEYSLFIYPKGRWLVYLHRMAVTKSIELRTEVPGPRSPEILDRKEPSSRSRSRSISRSSIDEGTRRDAHRRRRQHVHRLHRRRRLPQRRPLAPARRRGGAGAGGALLPHRLHDRPVRGLRRARRAAARARAVHRPREGGVLQRRRRGGRERGQVRALVHEAAGRHRASRARSTAARCSR